MLEVKLVKYNPAYDAAFTRLNLEWITTHFRVEPTDLAQLEDPREKILNPGGQIFFVLENGEPVGTCAMIPHGPGCFELAKMAVDPSRRGRGYGDLLIKHAVEWARTMGADRVTLLSNRVLKAAIALYHKHGFVTTRLGPHPDYERCDIEMELRFGK